MLRLSSQMIVSPSVRLCDFSVDEVLNKCSLALPHSIIYIKYVPKRFMLSRETNDSRGGTVDALGPLQTVLHHDVVVAIRHIPLQFTCAASRDLQQSERPDRKDLAARSRAAYETHFAWAAISNRFNALLNTR